MKVFTFIFVAMIATIVQVASVEPEMTEQMTEWMQECGKSLNIPETAMEKLKKNTESADIDEDKKDHLAHCWLNKSGMMKNGKIDTEVMMEVADKMAENNKDMEGFKDAIKGCCDEVHGMPDEFKAAGKFIDCIQKIETE